MKDRGMILRKWFYWAACTTAALTLVSCGFKHAKYDNPIVKDTQQPDKILFDKAVNDIEHGRYEVARLTLNTLINTYDTSEYLAKAKLAIADSWFREGGIQGLTQAEAEYKDFILFYPTMEESAESQKKLCDIHYKQMEKADRDPNQTLRAEQECKQVLTAFPNSKFAPAAEQELRNIQEVLAEGEMNAGDFYYHKGAWAASANRMTGIGDTYPLYSRVDEALWKEADAYSHMGPRFRAKSGDALTSLVRNYPLSDYADDAKKKLSELKDQLKELDSKIALAKAQREAAAALDESSKTFADGVKGIEEKMKDLGAATETDVQKQAEKWKELTSKSSSSDSDDVSKIIKESKSTSEEIDKLLGGDK